MGWHIRFSNDQSESARKAIDYFANLLPGRVKAESMCQTVEFVNSAFSKAKKFDNGFQAYFSGA
jgi:hypothetical protein